MTQTMLPTSLKGRLTGRSKDVFDFIVLHKKMNDGQSPTIREISDNTDITSTSVVQYYLDKLETKGLINLIPNEARGIQVLGGKWTFEGNTN